MSRTILWLAITAVIISVVIGSTVTLLGLAKRNNEAGSAAPVVVAMETVDGRKLSLADFRGRFLLLNIWATWCPPCVKEMPSLDRLQAAKGSDTFEVVALSLDRRGLEVVDPFFKRTGIVNLSIYLDRDARSMSGLKITGLPTTLLIDPSGREITRWAGAKEWDDEASIAEIEDRIEKAKQAAR